MSARIAFTPPEHHRFVGNSYGWRVTIEAMRRLLPEFGVELTAADDAQARVALHMGPPGQMRPTRHAKQLFFTMWESEALHDADANNVRLADAIIVPSEFCRRVFAAHTTAPVVVCPLGVDTEQYPFVDRSARDSFDEQRPFRWLWCGAPNARKGYDILGHVWNDAFVGQPNIELYMKTTGAERTGVVQDSNVIFDFRDVPADELAEIYASADAFVFPTGGEGYGLTLGEAMASGLPCVATRYSGHLDFAADDCVRLVDFTMVPTVDGDGRTTHSALARPEDLRDAMTATMIDYRAALRMGKRASKAMQRRTWRDAAASLASTLRYHARIA